jgi:hypothetical protein
VGGRSSLRPWSSSWRGRTEVCHSAAPRSRDGLCATTSGRVGPRVRIRFPPAGSPQTLGPRRWGSLRPRWLNYRVGVLRLRRAD